MGKATQQHIDDLIAAWNRMDREIADAVAAVKEQKKARDAVVAEVKAHQGGQSVIFDEGTGEVDDTPTVTPKAITRQGKQHSTIREPNAPE